MLPRTGVTNSRDSTGLMRGLLFITAFLAAVGGAAMYVFALPALWRTTMPYALVFTVLALVQIASAVAVLLRPTRGRALISAIAALAVLALWILARVMRVLPLRDPWIPVNSAIGFADYICAALEAIAAAGFAGVAASSPGPRRGRLGRAIAAVVVAPVTVLVLLGDVAGVFASSDGFAGSGFPAGTVPPRDLPAGQMSTVEYCRPAGVPLAMDIYMPPSTAPAGRGAPVALYVHGGGIWGDRKVYGLGAQQANHEGALFSRLERQLNARGFAVATIDYRLPPATPWPAQIEDSKCAVRFLRAHAADLHIDPSRIAVWGSSGGGSLVSLLGLAGPDAGFDRGQYLDQTSAVQAVVDLFGPADLNDNQDLSPFGRLIVQISLGSGSDLRRAASPITYVHPVAPPFLILHGTLDPIVNPRQSVDFAQRLDTAGVPSTFIPIEGAQHGLNTSGQHPSPDDVASIIVDFIEKTLD